MTVIWPRGFLLWWIVASVLWCALVGILRYDELSQLGVPHVGRYAPPDFLRDHSRKNCLQSESAGMDLAADCIPGAEFDLAKAKRKQEEAMRERIFWEITVPPLALGGIGLGLNRMQERRRAARRR